MYKTLYLDGNPNFEYQRRNGIWFRRKIGTKETWSKPDANGNKVLSGVYADKPALFFYSKSALFGGAVVVMIIGYLIYKKNNTQIQYNITK